MTDRLTDITGGYGTVYKTVMKDKDISPVAKAIYAYLSSYAGGKDTAFPSINLILHELNMSENRFHKHKKELVDKGIISITRERTDNGFSKNIYTINHHFVTLKNVGIQNVCIQNQCTKNNSIKNNNIKNNNKASGNPTIPFQEIIKYLNTKAKKNYRDTSMKTRKLIEARYNQKFNIDDFKKVIDNMTSVWIDDEKMNAYLRPETLFGTKFESYLNQTPSTVKKEQPKNTKQPKSESDNWLDKKRMEILGG